MKKDIRKKLFSLMFALLVAPISATEFENTEYSPIASKFNIGLTAGYNSAYPSEKIAIGIELFDFISIEGYIKPSPFIFYVSDLGIILQATFESIIVDSRFDFVEIGRTDRSFQNLNTFNLGLGFDFPIIQKSLRKDLKLMVTLPVIAGVTLYDFQKGFTYDHPIWKGYNSLPIYIDISVCLTGQYTNIK